MPYKETNLLQGIYLEHLKTINNVKLTRREIDIISFFVNGRSGKKVASFFEISPKTVENHTHNIMLKLHCNSREGIIDFVEKSEKLLILRKFYTALLAQTAFDKCLKDISNQIRANSVSCGIAYENEKNGYGFLIDYLEASLKLAGVKVFTQKRDPSVFIQELSKKNCVIYFVRRTEEGHQSKEHIFLLCPERQDPIDLFKELNIPETSDFTNQKDYTLLVLGILKKLFSNLDCEKIISEFMKEYEIIEGHIKKEPYPPPSRENIPDTEEQDANFRIKLIIKSKTFYVISALCFVGIVIFSFLGLKTHHEKRKNQAYPFASFQKSDGALIRSDLAIPNEYLLLNRSDIMEQINAGFKGKDGIQTIALVGIGGAGKTTLARYYARSLKDSIVLEINAETKETLNEAFEILAGTLSKSTEDKKIFKNILKIKNSIEKEEKIIQFVRERLHHHSGWFLVYNNVAKFADIQKYFPKDSSKWGKGRIIITTRNSNIGNNTYINHTIPIGEVTAEQKLDLFIKIMSNGGTHSFTSAEIKEVRKFLEDIPSFPLDISLAAYYIKATNVSYKDYLENIFKYNKDFSNVQEKILQEAGDYTNTRYGIITLSLNHLISMNDDFKDLLLLISLFDSQNIPRDLLIKYKSPPIVDNFIYHLKNHSLTNVPLTAHSEKSSFSLHRSTQAIILAYLMKTLELKQNNYLIQSFIQPLTSYMEDIIDKEDFEKMKNVYRHVEQFLSHANLLNNTARGIISGELGCFYYYLDNALKAKQFLTDSLSILRKSGNEESVKAAHFLVYLGNVYRDLGDYEKAKELFKKSLIIYKKYPGNDAGMAKASGYLGVVYRYLGDFKQAQALLERSLLIYKEKSENSIGLAWSSAHLGKIYSELGDFEKAKELLEQSLIIYKKYSQTHVGAAWVCGDLGYVYLKLGDYKKAKALLEESLAICKKHVYEDHAYVAKTLMYLGIYYREQGEYEKAKELLKNSATIFENTYGDNHIKTSFILKNLGQVYFLEGDLDTAEVFMKRALGAFHKNVHPDKYNVLEILAEIFLKKAVNAENKGDMQQAQQFKKQAAFYLEQACDTRRESLPEDSSTLKRIKAKLAAA